MSFFRILESEVAPEVSQVFQNAHGNLTLPVTWVGAPKRDGEKR